MQSMQMSQLDVAKEQIAYLKVWLGVFAVTDIGLLGWLASNFQAASTVRVSTCCVAILILSAFLAALHQKIDSRIEMLRDL